MEPEETFEQQPVASAEPLTVRTNGAWVLVEDFMNQKFEDGKTYRIKVGGRCQFAVSAKKPSAGIETNEITFKKEPDLNLWIKTGV